MAGWYLIFNLFTKFLGYLLYILGFFLIQYQYAVLGVDYD
jgi:hypothetical protein